MKYYLNDLILLIGLFYSSLLQSLKQNNVYLKNTNHFA